MSSLFEKTNINKKETGDGPLKIKASKSVDNFNITKQMNSNDSNTRSAEGTVILPLSWEVNVYYLTQHFVEKADRRDPSRD